MATTQSLVEEEQNPTWSVRLPRLAPDWGALDPNGDGTEEAVKGTSLAEMDKADMEVMGDLYCQASTPRHLASRAIDMLTLLNSDAFKLGGQVNLYEHSLQTATRAHRDGASDEIVVCALFHDVGEMMVPSNHGDVAAALLRPYISRASHWMLANHEVFQGYYYFEHYGMDPERRERLRNAGGSGSGNPSAASAGGTPDGAWEQTAMFCAQYDQTAFDPHYEWMELEDLMPAVEAVFGKTPWWDDPGNMKAGAVTGDAAEPEGGVEGAV